MDGRLAGACARTSIHMAGEPRVARRRHPRVCVTTRRRGHPGTNSHEFTCEVQHAQRAGLEVRSSALVFGERPRGSTSSVTRAHVGCPLLSPQCHFHADTRAHDDRTAQLRSGTVCRTARWMCGPGRAGRGTRERQGELAGQRPRGRESVARAAWWWRRAPGAQRGESVESRPVGLPLRRRARSTRRNTALTCRSRTARCSGAAGRRGPCSGRAPAARGCTRGGARRRRRSPCGARRAAASCAAGPRCWTW